MKLLARATSREVKWLEQLSDADAHALSITQWGVNGPFFMRRAVVSATEGAQVKTAFRSLKSSMHSSRPDTAAGVPMASPNNLPGGKSAATGNVNANAAPNARVN